jgi:hypothetical protein
MTPLFKGLAVILTAMGLWFLSLVILGLIARVTYLGVLTGWRLI